MHTNRGLQIIGTFFGPFNSLTRNHLYYSYNFKGNGAKLESKTTLVKRGKVGPCPAVRPAGLVPKLLTKFSSKSSLFSEKQNVDPRVHLPGCLQAELHLLSRHCLWCYWGMKGILDPFFQNLCTCNTSTSGNSLSLQFERGFDSLADYIWETKNQGKLWKV